ncbi:oligopeptide ABC transporter substrate-binding protein [Lactobacillus kitasatonis]|uniref:Oligopeptide ABC transporter substrate-binding protein n=1 Tax=Lactobacillus kitasatonis TaxID=237446 RepID=A0ABS1LVR7_9LACO|nr:oligopeptide ABC transporter substrate-binding protein [Lactobacillus kitasatonis]MBL1072254.1 oligopeptide ABC transporter substrate-binding protein [Lactobacillus kitasatonis]
MTKARKYFGALALISGATLSLVACSNNKHTNSSNANKTNHKFSETVPVKSIKKGGTLTYALETDSPFTGIFLPELSDTTIDTEVQSPGLESLFSTDDQYKINNKGAATFKLNRKAKTITIEVKKGVKWSDGKQVNAKDVEFAYEIIANKDSKSQRYTESLADIVGLAEYHEGKSKKISGIEMPDGENGRKVVLHFKQMKPGMLQSGNGYFWECAEPYHYLKDVPFSKLLSSDKVRKSPLFFGPFRVSNIVRGQSVSWERNPYYWRGTPNFEKVTASVVSSSSATQAIKSHKFDIADVVNTQWDQTKNATDTNFIGEVPLSYSYLAFKVGKWDKKLGKNVENKNAKMNNPALRKAMAYAMNIDAVAKRYYQGLAFRVNTLIPEQFGDFSDSSIKGYPYNLKKANQLLDKAGYKKKGEFRVQPNGKKLTINLAVRNNATTAEPVWRNYIQQWKKIGLNVKFVGGRPMEFNNWVQAVQSDDPKIDVFEGGWSLSSEPSPNDLYSAAAPYNMARFVSPVQSKLLADIDSEKAFNHKYRVDAFRKWQKWMYNEAYVVPTTNSYSITAVNKKVTGWSLKPSATNWFSAGFVK